VFSCCCMYRRYAARDMLTCAAARAPGGHSKMLILGSSIQVHEHHSASLCVVCVY
jgi:uncharacterized membrane protein AbrB (regulator of aidB expression)